jgi:superfamily II DNA or RNA helicase
MNPNYPARDYQEAARQAVVEGLRKVQRGLLVLPTGAGKNFVACLVMESYPSKNILFLADRNELIDQPWASINEFLGILAGVEKAAQHCDETDRIVVGSIQTLARRYKTFRPDRWDLIVADEAHLSMSESWQNVLGYFGQHARVLGMTATPFRTDGQSLMRFYEAEFYRKTIDNLQDEGWLVPLEIATMGTGIDINAIQIRKGIEGKKFDEQGVADTIEPYLEAIAKELCKKYQDRVTLAFLPLVEISKKFCAIARKVGLRAEHVDGKDPDREEKVNLFRAGKYQLLTNSQLLHTGFDAPICSATLNLTPMFSSVRYQQIIGRSTRPLKGTVDDPRLNAYERGAAISLSDKPDSIIFDPMFQFAEHGLMIPEALSASSAEEAQEIRAKRQRTGETNLQQAQRDYVLEKEREMLERLETQRRERQQREEDVMSVQEFALRTSNFPLATYIPVYSQETGPLKPFDKILLKQRGLDPESVTSRGQADLACRAVNIRRAKGMAEIPAVLRLIAIGMDVARAWVMSATMAKSLLRAHALRTYPAPPRR